MLHVFCICTPLQSPSLQNPSVSKLPVHLDKSGETNCEFWNIKSEILENHTRRHVSTRNKIQEKTKLKAIASGVLLCLKDLLLMKLFSLTLLCLTSPHLMVLSGENQMLIILP